MTASWVEAADAFAAMETAFERGWTDGLPVVPPTPELVAAFLDAAGCEGDEVLARIPTRENLVITAEKVAINAVMAGARPDYMPVIVAGVECLGDPRNNVHTHTATASGAAFITIVNGPVRSRIGLNCGRGAFGPGWRANATIGRTLRLVTRNVGRSVHGEFDQAVWSQPARFTFCVGEDEEESSWPTIAQDNGLSADVDAVTVYPFMTYRQAPDPADDDPERHLRAIACAARQPGPELGGPVDSGAPVLPGLTDREFHDVINGDFAPGRSHLVVMATRMQDLFGHRDKWAVREQLFHYMTEPHPHLRQLAIAGPELVWVASVGVEPRRAVAAGGTAGGGTPSGRYRVGAWVFTPHPPTNAVTRQVRGTP